MGSLTAIKVRNLKDAGRYSDGSGLILVLNQSGKASWIVRVQNAGRRRDIGIGSYPEISLGEARETAADVRRQAKAGIDVIAERMRQIIGEGFDTEHDDIHDGRQIAEAAAAYGLAYAGYASWAVNVWPWDSAWWKPSGDRRDLVKAGALILAEIERLDRAGGHPER